MKRVTLAMLACLTVAAGAWRSLDGRESTVPYYQRAALTPEWLRNSVANSASFHRVQQFALRDQHDSLVTAQSLSNHLTVVHFFFTQCGGVCPTTQTNIARLLQSVADTSLQVFSHSVTPERDSVDALRHYAVMHGISDRRWHLLTGQRSIVETLARNSYFVNLTNGTSYNTNNLAHTETLLLVDGQRRLRGVYTGTLPLDVNRLADDIRALAKENAQQ